MAADAALETERLLRTSPPRSPDFSPPPSSRITTVRLSRRESSPSIARLLLLLFLFYYLLISVAVLVFGAFISIMLARYTVHSPITWFADGVLAFGGILLCVAVLGCCGLRNGANRLLLLLAVGSVLLSLAVLAFFSFSWVWLAAAPAHLSTAWSVTNSPVRTMIQNKWDCCGFSNTSDRPALPCPVGSYNRPCEPLLRQDTTAGLRLCMILALAFAISAGVAALLSVLVWRAASRSATSPGESPRAHSPGPVTTDFDAFDSSSSSRVGVVN